MTPAPVTLIDPGPARPGVTFLPDPPRRPRRFPIISVDDHLIEPPNAFQGRMPRKYQDEGPRVAERPDGTQVWMIGDQMAGNVGFNSFAGRPESERTLEPARFGEMRRGTWDVHHRIMDMDLDGVWASLCFPSFPGFAGRRFSQLSDQQLGLAAVRAWNDWLIEEWAGPYPNRFIPCQITWLNDPVVAAEEVRKNAARGFKALSFSQAPHEIGYPSLYSGHWDPVMAACEETDTVVCLHFGTGKGKLSTAADAHADAETMLYPFYGAISVADWLFSEIPIRFPNLKIALSECGIGWVPFALDRLEFMEPRRRRWKHWQSREITAPDCLRRNFWFCALGERAGFEQRHRIGVDHILVESDYPHEDSTWPDTQAAVAHGVEDLPADDIERIVCQNAAELFRLDTASLAAWMHDGRDGDVADTTRRHGEGGQL